MRRCVTTIALSLIVLLACTPARQGASSPKALAVRDVSINVFTGWVEQTASLRRLSQELKNSPWGDIYIVRRQLHSIGTHVPQRQFVTRYDRRTRTLYVERNWDGPPYRWRKVSEKAIHAVAASESGLFKNLVQFGAVQVSPNKKYSPPPPFIGTLFKNRVREW